MSGGPLLDADATFCGFKSIRLGFPLRAEMAVGRLAIELFARTIVESRVRVDPDFDIRIALRMHDWGSSFRDPDCDQYSFPGV